MNRFSRSVKLADNNQCVVMRKGSNSLQFFFRIIASGGCVETSATIEFDGSYEPSIAMTKNFRPHLAKKCEHIYKQLLHTLAVHEDTIQYDGQEMVFDGATLEAMLPDMQDEDADK